MKMKQAVGAGVAAVTLGVVVAIGQEPARPAVRLFAEAEDFTARGEGWSVMPFRENYFASTFAISFLSRMGCLSAPEQMPADRAAVAEQQIEVPVADTYEVLARFEQPFQFACEFTVEIEQGGNVVFSQVFGRLEDPKIWAFNRHVQKPMERYWWGGTDNIVWQHPGAAALAAGPATIRLIAGPQMDGDKVRVNAARRHVDLVMLTNDRDGMEAQKKTRYLAFDGWLVQDGDLHVRITNRGETPAVPELAPFAQGQHSPYHVHVRDWTGMRVLGKGRLTGAAGYVNAGPRSAAVRPNLLAPELDPAAFLPPADPAKPAVKPAPVIPDAEKLQPGRTSGWIPMGRMVDALHDSKWVMKTAAPLELEFAVPDGKGGLRTVKKVAIERDTTFELPGNVAPNPELAKALQARWWLPEIRTQSEALTWLKGEVDKFPAVGRVPERLLVYNIGGFGSTPSTPEGRALMAALGDNTLHEQFKGRKRGMRTHWRSTTAEFYEKQDLSDVYIVSYGDEMHLPTAELTDEAFAAWLKTRGAAFDGPVEWTQDRAQPLYYYSVLAGVEHGAKPYVEATAYYKSKGALTGANYSPHANYLVSERHWVRPFKLNALSMAWSEDYVWQIPEFSVQVAGYLTTAFRCGVKYHGQPIQMYVMPHSPGNTPASFRRSLYACVANGATILNYFCASPLASGGTENYVATGDLRMWREIHRCTHEAGAFEDYVMDAKVRPARVGLLLSSVDDVWSDASNSRLAMHNNERKALYYALRHAQVPVDMITEDDVIDGLAANLDVIYATQQWMHTKCVEALRKWVEAGGTLVALCGGGFLDEFNRPSAAAGALYGVRTQQIETDPALVSRYLIQSNTPFLTKQDLPLYEPIDFAGWALTRVAGDDAEPRRIQDVPVIVWKQKLEPADGVVLGTFRDGSPAVVAKAHGKGRAYLFGFLPGQAYLKSGLPIRPADRGATDAAFTHYLPTRMDKRLRARLTDDFLPDGFARPVTCDRDLVETACLDTPAGRGRPARLAVPLINFTGVPFSKLAVRVEGVPKASAVRSVQHGALAPVFEGGAMLVDLPLDVADMLLIDR